MNEKQALREAMKLAGVNQVQLSKMMGFSSRGTIGNVLARKDMMVSTMVKMLDAIGYDVVIRGRTEVQAPGGSSYVPEWKIDAEAECE